MLLLKRPETELDVHLSTEQQPHIAKATIEWLGQSHVTKPRVLNDKILK